MRDRGIGDQLLHILLRQRHDRGVDDGDDRQDLHEQAHGLGGFGQHGQGEAQEAVTTHLEQHAGQDHRARRRGFHVGIRQPGVNRPHGHLHRERCEECQPQPDLQVQREAQIPLHQYRDIRRALGEQQGHDRDQHQHRADQRVEEELEGRVDPARTTPDADDQEHRDQHGFEEHVEQHQIQRDEGADHQRFEHQKGDHVFLDPGLHRAPGREDAQRRQQR